MDQLYQVMLFEVKFTLAILKITGQVWERFVEFQPFEHDIVTGLAITAEWCVGVEALSVTAFLYQLFVCHGGICRLFLVLQVLLGSRCSCPSLLFFSLYESQEQKDAEVHLAMNKTSLEHFNYYEDLLSLFSFRIKRHLFEVRFMG